MQRQLVYSRWGNRQGKVRLFQLGDGAIYYQSDNFGHVGVKSDDLFSNQTNALGYSKSRDDWAYKEINLTHQNHGIILMTDGISEDLLNEQLFTSAIDSKSDIEQCKAIKKYIQHELIHWPTPQHSDDKSIGIIFWKKMMDTKQIIVKDLQGATYTLTEKIGEGGQGTVLKTDHANLVVKITNKL